MNIQRVKVICEEAYAESIWCKQLLGGLTKELKKRRIAYELIKEVEALNPEEAVCIIGMSLRWEQKVILTCNRLQAVPILLSAHSKRPKDGRYHFVGPDMKDTAHCLKEALERAGRSEIAFYGANLSEDIDQCRVEMFTEIVWSGAVIYQNTGNLESCFRTFLPKAGLYDTVLCSNGYAAMSLVKKLEKEAPGILERLRILSFEEVLKTSKYNRWISVIDLHLEACGAAVLQVIDLLQKLELASAVTVELKGTLCEIDKKEHESAVSSLEDSFYEDPEIIQMAKIEQLLQDADDMDHHIIAMLMDNAKYTEIADSCYMTEGNVKYRVKKYMGICGCKTKKELLELLQEYLQ